MNVAALMIQIPMEEDAHAEAIGRGQISGIIRSFIEQGELTPLQ